MTPGAALSSLPDGVRLGTSLFSLTNAFHSRRYSLAELIARVAELRLGRGLEVIGFQSIRGFPRVTDEFAAGFRELLSRHGLEPSCLGTYPDAATRRDRRMTEDESVAYQEAQILAAAKLGFRVARVQTGAGPAVVKRLVPLAERVQVKLGVEIQGPHGVDSPEVLAFREMYEEVGSPCLGFIPDFGACARRIPPSLLASVRQRGASEELIRLALELWAGEGDVGVRSAEFRARAAALGGDPVAIRTLGVVFFTLGRQDPESWREIMPQVVHAHGKFYDFDAAGSEPSIPYDELLRVFRSGGYTGYVVSEWGGVTYSDEDDFEQVQAHHALCRRILGRGSAAQPPLVEGNPGMYEGAPGNTKPSSLYRTGASMSSSPTGLRLGTSLFSLTNAFYSREYTLEKLIGKVAELRLGPGLEVVGFQSIRGFPQVTDEFAAGFRELLSRHGLEQSCLGTNADVALRRDRRLNEDESVAYHEAQIRAAAKLGFPVARVQIGAGPGVLRRLVPLAEQVQVKLGVEIHAPQGVDTPEVLELREMYEEVGSPFLGFIPDFGACARGVPNGLVERARILGASEELIRLALDIWHGEGEDKGAEFRERASQLNEDPAAVIAIGIIFNILGRKDPQSWNEIMPQVVHLHGKFYEFDAEGNETSIPYDELIAVFRDGGYSGYLSNEWEGTIFSDEDGFEHIQKHHALCRRILERGPAAQPALGTSASR